jgi:putative transposase
MRKSKFTEEQIVAMLKQHEAGMTMAEVSRQNGISLSTFQSWKARYGGMEVSELRRVKQLEEENSRLKRMYAELSMINDAMKAVIEKKWGA